MRDNRINLCTMSLRVSPEAYGTVAHPEIHYACEKDGLLVTACKHFKPMVCAGGLICHTECHYFENGCTSRVAIKACRRRAAKSIGYWLKRFNEDAAGGTKTKSGRKKA